MEEKKEKINQEKRRRKNCEGATSKETNKKGLTMKKRRKTETKEKKKEKSYWDKWKREKGENKVQEINYKTERTRSRKEMVKGEKKSKDLKVPCKW